MAIVSLEDVKTFLGIAEDDTSQDNRLAPVVDAFCVYIPTYLGRILEETEFEDELYDGTGLPTLVLKNYPITEITSITVNGDDFPEVTYEERMSSIIGYYIHNANNGILMNLSIWPRGRGNILISYKAGYDEIPADIIYATLKTMEHYWALNKRSAGVLGESLGSYSYSLATGYNAPEGQWYIPNEARVIFDTYRDISSEFGGIF